MTTVDTSKIGKALTETSEPKKALTLSALLSAESIKARFTEVLGDRAPAFISSIISAVSMNNALKACDPGSVVSAAAVAATLDLPISSSLGFSHIVPYSGKAQFQMGWKGFIQLAMRSGQYRTINLSVVYEGQLIKHDPFTGSMELDASAKKSDVVIGYLLYFRLSNGYEKYFYMTRQECEAHGKKYSKSYSSGQWAKNFDAMALKTVAKLGLSKYGILSVAMQKAVEVDQAVIGENEKPEYVDAKTAEEAFEQPFEAEIAEDGKA
jgi:recombination protein RecT